MAKKYDSSKRNAKREERISICVSLLKKGVYTYQIKEAIRKKFGKLNARTIQDDMKAAREILREDYGISTDEHKEDAYNFYRNKRNDPKVSDRDQLRAQERIDKLLGLEFREQTDERDINVNIDFQGIVDTVRQVVREEKKKDD